MAIVDRAQLTLRARVLAVMVAVPVVLLAVVAYVSVSAPIQVTISETEWSEGGSVFMTNHTEMHLAGGSTFRVFDWSFITSCSGAPTVSSPFSVTSHSCVNYTTYGMPMPAWTVTVQAPDETYSGPLEVDLPS